MRSTGSGALGLQGLWSVGPVVAAPRIQSTGSVAVCTGLHCSEAVASSRPGIESRSAALAGGLLTTGPAGKPVSFYGSVKEGSTVNPDKGAHNESATVVQTGRPRKPGQFHERERRGGAIPTSTSDSPYQRNFRIEQVFKRTV